MTAFSAQDLCRHAGSMKALARDLLADDALADDAVQQACLTALTRPPAARTAVASWLFTVVRSCALDLRRSEQRRHRRERLAARGEASEPVDAAEQLELQQDLVAAVRSLSEPYRTAVWLRYFEDRSPSEIAAQLGEPAKTIKTRLWRALQQLRQQLDGRHGERNAWFAALVPLARLTEGTTGLGAAFAAGTLFMQAKHLVVAAVAVLLLVAGTAWMWPDAAAAPGVPTAPPIARSDANANAGEAPVADVAQRVDVANVAAVEAPPPPPYGSLRVRVLWHDGTPAADVAIAFLANHEPQLDRNEVRVVSDATGLALAERLHAGAVTLSSDRGGSLTAEVEAGASREVEFVLPAGLDVTGVVVDERQRAVASAEVVLLSPRGGWLGGRIVASAGADGTFAVRAVAPTWSLGAIAAGYAPSELVDLETIERPAGAASVHVQLQLLQPGASVVGAVVDENGKGIAGALLVLGRGRGAEHQEGRTRETWCPRVLTTDANGAFRCEGIAPGRQQIAARAAGHARVASEVHCVAGQSTSVTLTLPRAVAVHGTAHDEQGEPVADAIVLALDTADEGVPVNFAISFDLTQLKQPQTRSDALGWFRLDGVAPGELHLIAAKRRDSTSFVGVARTSIPALPGDELTWDPVLVAGKELRVRVVDADGKPCFQRLEAFAEQPAGAASQLSVLPERKQVGLTVFTDCADVPYTIVARVLRMGSESRWVYLRGVRPGGSEVELRLPPSPPPGAVAQVAGRIADLGHRLDGRQLSVSLCTREMVAHPQVDGDRFLAKDVLPGRYFVRAKAGDDTVLVGPWFEVQSGQQLDLGDLVTEPGASIRVALHGPAGADLGAPSAGLDDGFHWRRLQWNGSHLVADNVTVGRHRVLLTTNGWHAPPREVELAAGRDNLFTIDVVPGAMRRFEITLPLPEKWQHGELTLRDAQGHVMADLRDLGSAGNGLRPYLWNAFLPFRELTLVAGIDGTERSWPLDLREPANTDKLLRFSLR